jgi:hypothetical protein
MKTNVVSLTDKFVLIRKLCETIKELGYVTGNSDGNANGSFDNEPNICTVLYPPVIKKHLFGRQSTQPDGRIHCRLTLREKKIDMDVYGRGNHKEHLEEMKRLAENISSKLSKDVSVHLKSESVEYDLSTQLSWMD